MLCKPAGHVHCLRLKFLGLEGSAYTLTNPWSVQNLNGGAPPAAGPPSVSVAGRRLLQSQGVTVGVDITAPSDLSEAVNQALQQAISSGAFQSSLQNNGESC